MNTTSSWLLLAALVAAPATILAGEPSAAAARAKTIAPFVDDTTAAVAHVDLTRLAAGPIVEFIGQLFPDVKNQPGLPAEAKRIGQLVESVVKSGGKDVYFTVSLGARGRFPSVLAVIPMAANGDEMAILAALEIPAKSARRVGDALVIRLPPMDNLPIEIHASPRPELTAAFAAAGEGTAQAVLIPPAYTRRVVEELMPQLPKEVGNGPSSVLTRGISWAAVGLDLPPHLALRAVIKSQDAQSAAALKAKWAEILRLAGQDQEVRRAIPQFDRLATLLTPQVEADRLVLNLDSPSATIETLVAALATPVGKARDAARRTQSMNNLKQTALAMHMFYQVHRHLPAAATCNAQGKPLLSWRVYILPYIEQVQLYNQFHLDEPWDSPHNKPLISKMPAVFRSPASKAENGKTNYLVPVGDGALYGSSSDTPKFEDVKDGLSQTIMMVEVDDVHAVTWTRPDDYAFDPKDPKKGIGSLYAGGFIAAFGDGSIRFLSGSIDTKTLDALFTRAGGEAVGPY
jgi:hypothetical protein